MIMYRPCVDLQIGLSKIQYFSTGIFFGILFYIEDAQISI